MLANKVTHSPVATPGTSHLTAAVCDLRGNFLTFWEGGRKVNRKTAQKMAVLRVLYTSKQHHLTAEQLFKLVKRQIPTISDTTVYRTLKRLVEEGLAVRMQLLPEVDHFERVRETHAHVVCDGCEKIEDAPAQTLAGPKRENRIKNFTVTHTDITFHGVCKSCRQRSSKPVYLRRT